jgi:hypothetical protein
MKATSHTGTLQLHAGKCTVSWKRTDFSGNFVSFYFLRRRAALLQDVPVRAVHRHGERLFLLLPLHYVGRPYPAVKAGHLPPRSSDTLPEHQDPLAASRAPEHQASSDGRLATVMRGTMPGGLCEVRCREGYAK